MNHDWHLPRRLGIETEPSPASNGAVKGPDAALEPVWETLVSSANIQTAWERVRRNAGAPGVDGVTVRDLEASFPWEWQQVNEALHAGCWTPKPARRVSIPKPSGGWRRLGIPTVLDRVLHQALAQVLTPRWEARFSPRSFGFRKGRGAENALNCLANEALRQSSPLVWHLDIRDFFDRVPRLQAQRAVSRVCADERLQRLVSAILSAGSIDGTSFVPTPCGLPQGSPLSPLLANAVLHPLDLWMTEQGLPFIRYADDIAILLPSALHLADCRAFISEKLLRLGLELNETKCELTPLSEASILGFCLYSEDGRWRRRISERSWQAFEQERRRRGTWAYAFDDVEKQGTAHDYAQSWASYFSLSECPQDHARLADLRKQTNHGPTSARVRMGYDGRHSGRTRPLHRTAAPLEQPEPADDWRSSFSTTAWRCWLARLFTRRWISFGLDFGRGLRAIRVRIGPLNLRFRL